ncbi:hypothetical protein [Mesomycoplasma lagogenitalium]|uniref:CopG family transcriptional regulator n=1 Tax=Mesomycoplasma lagogenitalium TaxID=171286 RepID=A0ABY8LW76_9BACT|nr:hypothetical protein [Mesomycoplasma lagogenitalium]WGI36491.1 hypothetical protein QEG99_03435 [Mesomycoplasma lagogenitalium]
MSENKKVKYNIHLTIDYELKKCLEDLADQGLVISRLTTKALKQFIKNNYPAIAEKNNLK